MFTQQIIQKLTAFISIFLISSTHLFAAPTRGVISLNGGPGWYKITQKSTIYLQPEFYNTYVPQDTTNKLTNIGLFLGIQKDLKNYLQARFGISGAMYSKAHHSGNIWELSDETFNNFTYIYNIEHSQLALEGKILTNIINNTFLPYFNAKFGIANNKSSGFVSNPLIFEVLPQTPFTANTQTSFTYSVGAGFMAVLNTNWQAGIGYMFTNIGKSSLGVASNQTTTNQLTLNHLYINGLQCSISYLS